MLCTEERTSEERKLTYPQGQMSHHQMLIIQTRLHSAPGHAALLLVKISTDTVSELLLHGPNTVVHKTFYTSKTYSLQINYGEKIS